MKIAVLGDVHANLPALAAALDAARGEGADMVVHTGDLVGFGPFPVEVVREIDRLGIAGVRGNLDDASAFGFDRPGVILPGDPGIAERMAALRWTQAALDFPARARLRDLPFERRFVAGGRQLALYHANPLDNLTPVHENGPDHVLRDVARQSGAEVVVLGHTHIPFHKVLDGAHLVNAGSVGMPMDGDPRAHLVILDLNGGVRVRQLRVPYDIERTASAMERAGLPGLLAGWLRRGGPGPIPA